jgi:hypothetical protein
LIDIIEGTSAEETESPSILQLRNEAGLQGLRFKAKEADDLRIFVTAAGGLDVLKDKLSLTAYVQPLVETVGGPYALNALVSGMYVTRPLEEQYNALKDEVEKGSGLRAKAARYDAIKGTFMAIEGFPLIQKSTQVSSILHFGVHLSDLYIGEQPLAVTTETEPAIRLPWTTLQASAAGKI